MRPTYYRGCWHVVSRRFLLRYRQCAERRSAQLTVNNLQFTIKGKNLFPRCFRLVLSFHCSLFIVHYSLLIALSFAQRISSLSIELYNPKAFFTHAASLHQSFLHCAIFPTAASRRSLGRVSVPMWPYTLSGRLPIVGLVGRYPANCLIGRGPIPYHRSFSHKDMHLRALMRF